ncbi:UNVERIFIED_CONTAM: protein STICHEL-like 3 [Sesamum latifolium]|uniref:Protein STICHEL-like 3 n=1 Tax=Sesamum latifolium TaxID=2727402 RepID=A0AAW2WL13_9LAMI
MSRTVRNIRKDVNGNISDHLADQIHLTNCIHLKNHVQNHSPILANRVFMENVVMLQRSSSLRDPSASSPAWNDVLQKGKGNALFNGRWSVCMKCPKRVWNDGWKLPCY